MKLHGRSTLQLHDLYHRREGDRYVVGDPETGEHLSLSAAELRVVRLLAGGLDIARVDALAREEKDRVDVHALIHALIRHRLIHMIDDRVVAAKHEPLHEIPVRLPWIADPVTHYLLFVIIISGIWTLMWRGTIPGPGAFFFQDSLFLTLLASVLIAWVIIFLRQLAKYGHAQAFGLNARFGIASHHHWLAPKTFLPPTTEEQEHRVLASGLIVLLAITMLAGTIATWTHNAWWTLVFLISIIEILAECLLFLDTDLARYIGFRANIHRLNEQTRELLSYDWRELFTGKGRQAHIRISAYAFLYLSSMVLAVILAAVYILPIALGVLALEFARLIPGHALFADSVLVLSVFTIELFLYGFATIKRHPLAHNTLFLNISVAAIVFASFLAATLAVQWLTLSEDTILTAFVLYVVGIVLALAFERAVALAHPFSELHSVYEAVLVPTIAACVPLSVLFTVAGEPQYFEAAMLAVGMLSAIALIEMRRTTTVGSVVARVHR